MESTQVSVKTWMDKENVVCVCDGILLTLKKEGNFAIWENLDKDIQLREIRQMQTNSAWFCW